MDCCNGSQAGAGAFRLYDDGTWKNWLGELIETIKP